MNAADRPNSIRWLQFALVVATLAGSPAAWANCCDNNGATDDYKTNTTQWADCILKFWLTPPRDFMGVGFLREQRLYRTAEVGSENGDAEFAYDH